MPNKPELYGLVLAGGQSVRMGRDKGLLVYEQLSPQAQQIRIAEMLNKADVKPYISKKVPGPVPGRAASETEPGTFKTGPSAASPDFIYDLPEVAGEEKTGPGVGILSAHLFKPEVAWFVIACDFPFASVEAIQYLIQQRRADGIPTANQHPDETTEPLFTIWEPETLAEFLRVFHAGYQSPRLTLEKEKVHLVKPINPKILININSPLEARDYGELQ